MDELIGKSDAAEKCIGGLTKLMPQFEQFSDLNFDGLLDRLKKEICHLASDIVKGAVDGANDTIDDALNNLIGNVTLPDGTRINPINTVMPQNPGIGYIPPDTTDTPPTYSPPPKTLSNTAPSDEDTGASTTDSSASWWNNIWK